MSYFSRDSRPFGFQVGADWAEELDKAIGRAREINSVSETVERLIFVVWLEG